MSLHLNTRFLPGRALKNSWMARIFVLLAVLGLGWTAHYVVAQSTNIVVTTAFTPANPARGNQMDVGGVWNGTTEVTNSTGDTFTLNISNPQSAVPANPAANTLYSVRPSVTLPDGFHYVPNSAAGADVTQVGQTLTFALSLADIAPGAQRTITYGVRADSSVINGTYANTIQVLYKTTSGGPDSTETVGQAIIAARGDSVISKTPQNQVKVVNDTASWTVSVTNTGLGGLFDVVIDESAPGSGLQINTITQTSPATPPATEEPSRVMTIPYLAPGQTFTLNVSGTVVACTDIHNTVSTNDRTGATAGSLTAAVTLNLLSPSIGFTVPDVTLEYGQAVPVSIPVENSGDGPANFFEMRSKLHESNVIVSNVGSGWSYNSETGSFSYTNNGGTLAAGTSATLTFSLSQPSACTINNGADVVWQARYVNMCSQGYITSPRISEITGTDNVPTLTLTKTSENSRVVISSNNTARFYLNVTVQNASRLAEDATGDVVVTDTLPLLMQGPGLAITPPAGTTYDVEENVLIWTIPRSVLLTDPNLTLQIDFDIPTDACLGGELLNNTATATVTTITGCALTSSSTASILLVNNPDAVAVQDYNVGGAPNGSFETGTSSADDIRAVGEGEFIPITSSYGFSAGYPGKFAGSTYVDNFASIAGQTLVPGTLRVAVDGGAAQSVPTGSILQTVGQLQLNLAFLEGAGFADDANVAGHSFVFTYQTTVPDSALPLPGVSRTVTQVATLNLADGVAGGGICENAIFRQGDFYSISRAAVSISVSMPNEVDSCAEFPVTITIDNVNSQQARNVMVTIPTTGDYAYAPGQTPVYGGSLIGNVTYTENGGNNPTFQVNTSTLTGPGTIVVQMQRKLGTGTDLTPVQARVDYDDNETAPAAARTFNTSAGDAPAIVKEAMLALTVTPQATTIVGTTAEWVIYINNTGNGTAYNSVLTDEVPNGVTLDLAATNAANPLYPATFDGTTLSWDLGNLPSGAIRVINVRATVDGTSCTPNNNLSIAAVEWGCLGDYRQTAQKNSPVFTLATGKLQVLHDTSQSFFGLCEQGVIGITMRNTGAAHIYDAELREVLTAGMTLVSDSVEVSLNGGAYTPASDPAGNGSLAAPYLWTKTEIPALADLSPQGGSGTSEVRVRFKIETEEFLSAQPTLPQITASMTGRIACGSVLDSPGLPFPVPARRPNITVVKEGRNITANPTAAFGETVYGGVGDVVEWRIRITNSGQLTARNVRLKDVFAGSGTTTALISGPAGFTTPTITDNTPLTIIDIPSDTTHTYTITETLGSTCVDADNTASVTWGCANNGANAESNISWPTTNNDTARLNSIPNFSDTGNLTQANTTSSPAVDNGRVRGRFTLTNSGGTAQTISIDVTMPNNLVLDTTTAPTVSSTTSTGGGIFNAITVTGSHPTYTFTLNASGRLRNGQNVEVTYYMVQNSNFDTMANGGVPLDINADPSTFQSPETTGNLLDPALPANGSIVLALKADSTCGVEVTAPNTASVNPLTPDLDITVTPTTQTVQTDGSYIFDFYYTIINSGDANSVANRIVFRLPIVGSTWQSTSIFGPNGETGTTSITLTQTIPQGTSRVVRVRAVTNPVPTTFDLRLIGEVEGSIFGHDGTTDTTNNYSLDRAAPVISSDVNLAGYVYNDLNINAQRDAGENGTGLTLWAKLVPTGGTAAVKVVSVNAGTGAYQFIQVDDGSYSVIIDDNDDPADITPAVLAGWLGSEYPELERSNVIVGNTNVFNQNFGLYNSGVLQGKVFKDTGTGGGTANDGIFNGTEAGIPAVVVRLTDMTGNTVYASTVTDVNGNYRFNVPGSIATGTTLRVVQTNISGYISTGGEPGNSAGTYNRAADAITFVYTQGGSYTGLNFGDVPPSEFITDGNKTVAPGGVVYFPHTFTAATAGEVTFSTTHNATPNQPGWTQIIFLDANNNGIADPGESVINGPIPVIEGDNVHIVIQEFAPAAATNGAQDVIRVTANFTLATATPAIVQTLVRTDIATVSLQHELLLEKAVDLPTANRGETLTYTITYRNPSTQPISNLVINDGTPAFTTFVSAAYGTTPAGLIPGTFTAPTVGAAGALSWPFTGTLAAGATGTVTFQVKINE